MVTEEGIRKSSRSFRKLLGSPRLRPEVPRLVAKLEAEYRSDANPLHVWEAYALVRAANLTTPTWVLAYFDRVAETLLVLSIKPPGERQVANAAARALELPRGGRRNVFLDWPKQNHAQWITSQVQSLLDEGHKLYEAARQVGSEHPTPICRELFPQCRKALSRATVEGYYKRLARKP